MTNNRIAVGSVVEGISGAGYVRTDADGLVLDPGDSPSIGTADIAAGAITTPKLADSAVTAAKIATGIISEIVTPEQYGAIGDGVTIDTDAIQSAVTAAGVNGTVLFNSGKTYLVDGQITLLDGQTIDLNWSTVKRAPQQKTTLTAGFSAIGDPAPQTISCTSTSAFRVGSGITLCKPTSQGDDTENRYRADTQNHHIISKTSTTLTVQGNFQYAYSIADEVVSTFIMFVIPSTSDNVTICNGVIDGSTPDHDSAASGDNTNGYQVRGRRWETTVEVSAAGEWTKILNVYFLNSPCESVIIAGDNSLVSDCKFENIGGNATHFSGGNYSHVSNCTTIGSNRVWIEHDARVKANYVDYGTVGHENGAYAWSLYCNGCRLTNSFASSAKSLASPPNSSLNDHAFISGCQAYDCQLPFYTNSTSDRSFGTTIANCLFMRCGTGYITRTQEDPTEAQADVYFQLLNCNFEETNLSLDGVYKFRMTGGYLYFNNPATAPGGIILHDVVNSEISATIDGAAYGMYMDGSIKDVDIAIRCHRLPSYAINGSDVDSDSRGIRICGGFYRYDLLIKRDGLSDLTTSSSVVGIYPPINSLLENNSFYMATGRAAVEIGKSRSRVNNNNIETSDATTTRPVLVGAGTDSFVTNNWITVAVRDDTGGAGATIANNTTIPWVS